MKYRITPYPSPSTGKMMYILEKRWFLFIWENIRVFDEKEDAIAYCKLLKEKIKI